MHSSACTAAHAPSGPVTPSNTPAGLPSVTLNRQLFEGALRDLLLEGGQHSVELWDGYGAHWKVAKWAGATRGGRRRGGLCRASASPHEPLQHTLGADEWGVCRMLQAPHLRRLEQRLCPHLSLVNARSTLPGARPPDGCRPLRMSCSGAERRPTRRWWQR
jgi:hypothetical protein